MPLADFQRCFAREDFRGYFKWTESLSSSLTANLYHACHEKELVQILEEGRLLLRSRWGIRLPEHGECNVPGTWTGLNYYSKGNYYGPFLIEFPIEVLNGRRFMVFRRQGEDRDRHFFVQYEALIPIFSFGDEVWRSVRPQAYFRSSGENLRLKAGAIYDLVLTQTVALDEANAIYAVSHPRCIPEKCSGLTELRGQGRMRQVARKEFLGQLKKSGIIRRMIERFPDIEGTTIEIEFDS